MGYTQKSLNSGAITQVMLQIEPYLIMLKQYYNNKIVHHLTLQSVAVKILLWLMVSTSPVHALNAGDNIAKLITENNLTNKGRL